MTTEEKLIYHSGWRGGTWVIGDGSYSRIAVKDELPERVVVKYDVMLLPAIPCLVDGIDHDHGHSYPYKSLDFLLEVETEIGTLPLSLKDLITVYEGDGELTIIINKGTAAT